MDRNKLHIFSMEAKGTFTSNGKPVTETITVCINRAWDDHNNVKPILVHLVGHRGCWLLNPSNVYGVCRHWYLLLGSYSRRLRLGHDAVYGHQCKPALVNRFALPIFNHAYRWVYGLLRGDLPSKCVCFVNKLLSGQFTIRGATARRPSRPERGVRRHELPLYHQFFASHEYEHIKVTSRIFTLRDRPNTLRTL